MTKNVLTNIFSAARELLRGWPALGVLSLLYAALLGAFYLFITTREASVWQLLVTIMLAVAVPLLFFVLQAGSARAALGETRPIALLAQALRNSWKLVLVSLPLIALAALFIYGTNKLEQRVKPSEAEMARLIAERQERAESRPEGAPAPQPPVRWSYVTVIALRLLLLGVVLPLLTISLWLAVARDGLGGALRRLGNMPTRAFAPQTILTYAIGMILFALVPYFLLFAPTRVASNWLELTFFSLRLLLAFVFTLFGWTLTMRALARANMLGTDVPESSSAVAQ
ncbi:MAG: hypothetical protein M3371_11695 [Acidobacteriota bacterium]|nr:hypothetical protein [Acidobacteriota bacterium]